NTKLPNTCADCGKRTNKVNRSEMNPELCNTCYAKAELEADHQDGQHTEYMKGCYLCNEERNKAMEDNELSDHWVNVHARRQPDCTACDLVAKKATGELTRSGTRGPPPLPLIRPPSMPWPRRSRPTSTTPRAITRRPRRTVLSAQDRPCCRVPR